MRTVRLPLSNGKFALIDEADEPLVRQYTWTCYWHRTTWRVRRCFRKDGRSHTVYLHRFLMGDIPTGARVSHRNGDGLDNRRANLEVVPYRYWKESREAGKRPPRNEFGVPADRLPMDNGDGTATLPLTKGMVSIIDATDIPLVSQRMWHASKSANAFYARGVAHNVRGSIQLHRFLLNPLPHLQVDHINGDTLDNRRCNLRVVSGSENMKHWARYHFGGND